MTDTARGPAFTSASVPRPAGTPKDLGSLPQEVKAAAAQAVDYSLDSIVAEPLNSPDFVNLHPVNPGISFRWVMHTLFKQDGTQNCIRFEEAKQQGFVVASAVDIKNPPMAYQTSDGKFINGDLILMKMDRRRYEGALLFKDQAVAKQMLAANGKSAVGKVQQEVASKSARGKIQAYTPTQSELEAFVSGDSNEAAQQL